MSFALTSKGDFAPKFTVNPPKGPSDREDLAEETEKDAIESKDVFIDPTSPIRPTSATPMSPADHENSFDGKEWVLVFPVAFFASFCLVAYFCYRKRRREEKKKRVRVTEGNAATVVMTRRGRVVLGEEDEEGYGYAGASDYYHADVDAAMARLDEAAAAANVGDAAASSPRGGAFGRNPLSPTATPSSDVRIVDMIGTDAEADGGVPASTTEIVADAPVVVTVTAPTEDEAAAAAVRASARPPAPQQAQQQQRRRSPQRLRGNIITTTVNGTVIQLSMGDTPTYSSLDPTAARRGGGDRMSPQRLPGFVRGMLSPSQRNGTNGANAGAASAIDGPPTIITTFHGGIATVTRVTPAQHDLQQAAASAQPYRNPRLPRRRPQQLQPVSDGVAASGPLAAANEVPHQNGGASAGAPSQSRGSPISLANNSSAAFPAGTLETNNSNSTYLRADSYAQSLHSYGNGNGSPLMFTQHGIQMGLPMTYTEHPFGGAANGGNNAAATMAFPMHSTGSLMGAGTIARGQQPYRRSPLLSEGVPSCYGKGGSGYLSHTFGGVSPASRAGSSQKAHSAASGGVEEGGAAEGAVTAADGNSHPLLQLIGDSEGCPSVGGSRRGPHMGASDANAGEEDSDYFVGVLLGVDALGGSQRSPSPALRSSFLRVGNGGFAAVEEASFSNYNNNSTSNSPSRSATHLQQPYRHGLGASPSQASSAGAGGFNPRGQSADPHRPIATTDDDNYTISTATNSVCFDLNSAQPQYLSPR